MGGQLGFTFHWPVSIPYVKIEFTVRWSLQWRLVREFCVHAGGKIMLAKWRVYSRNTLTKISHVISHEENIWELEHFHIWNFHSTYEMGIFSHMKYLIHMWNEVVHNFTCEILVFEKCISPMKWKIHSWILISHTKFLFQIWNWNNSHRKFYF